MTARAKPLEIITIGGSLGGLMSSIALRRLGHNVKILERSPTPLLHDQGAGIVAGGDAQSFMHQYDKTQSPFSVASKERLYLDKAGNVVERESKEQQMTSWDLVYHLCRANFDGLKSDYLGDQPVPADDKEGKGVYQHGSLVTGVEKVGGQVKISYRSTLEGQQSDEIQHAMADFLIVAEGSSSQIRGLLSPSSKAKTYAGYLAFRGTVPETELSPEAKDVFVEKFPFYHGSNTQILGYVIPGQAGNLEPGKRLVNWVWYVNVEWDSEEYRDIMTDREGTAHRYTLPPGGKMQEKVWEAQKARARDLLPFQFCQLIEQTKNPFVQAITDLEPAADKKCWYLDGKAVLVGDAVAGFRPHTAASTTQAAFNAIQLGKLFDGTIDQKSHEEDVMEFAKDLQHKGVVLGDRSQFGKNPHEH